MTRAPEVFDWIVDHLGPVWNQDGARLYDGMESQSGFSLPLIHVPFEPDALAHWEDRGRILDFRAVVGGGKILDFGSGDGWPCLPLAAMVEEVVAVDASAHLLAGAQANAERLGIRNVSFVGIQSATALPFADETFDGVTASSSLEQTEDPAAALAEVRRVVRPGGRLRMFYEPPSRYRPGEHGLWLMGHSDGTSLLFVSAYDPDAERAQHIRLHFDLSKSEIRRRMTGGEGPVAIEQLSLPLLESLVPHVRDACGARLRLPRGKTWLRLLEEAGFAETEATQCGKEAAADLYARVGAGRRPRTLSALDDLLRPDVDEAVRTPCDVVLDPMITARLS